jgi:hypothetical protein
VLAVFEGRIVSLSYFGPKINTHGRITVFSIMGGGLSKTQQSHNRPKRTPASIMSLQALLNSSLRADFLDFILNEWNPIDGLDQQGFDGRQIALNFVAFWIATKDFVVLPPSVFQCYRAGAIFDSFLVPGSPRSVPVSETVRAEISDKILGVEVHRAGGSHSLATTLILVSSEQTNEPPYSLSAGTTKSPIQIENLPPLLFKMAVSEAIDFLISEVYAAYEENREKCRVQEMSMRSGRLLQWKRDGNRDFKNDCEFTGTDSAHSISLNSKGGSIDRARSASPIDATGDKTQASVMTTVLTDPVLHAAFRVHLSTEKSQVKLLVYNSLKEAGDQIEALNVPVQSPYPSDDAFARDWEVRLDNIIGILNRIYEEFICTNSTVNFCFSSAAVKVFMARVEGLSVAKPMPYSIIGPSSSETLHSSTSSVVATTISSVLAFSPTPTSSSSLSSPLSSSQSLLLSPDSVTASKTPNASTASAGISGVRAFGRKLSISFSPYSAPNPRQSTDVSSQVPPEQIPSELPTIAWERDLLQALVDDCFHTMMRDHLDLFLASSQYAQIIEGSRRRQSICQRSGVLLPYRIAGPSTVLNGNEGGAENDNSKDSAETIEEATAAVSVLVKMRNLNLDPSAQLTTLVRLGHASFLERYLERSKDATILQLYKAICGFERRHKNIHDIERVAYGNTIFQEFLSRNAIQVVVIPENLRRETIAKIFNGKDDMFDAIKVHIIELISEHHWASFMHSSEFQELEAQLGCSWDDGAASSLERDSGNAGENRSNVSAASTELESIEDVHKPKDQIWLPFRASNSLSKSKSCKSLLVRQKQMPLSDLLLSPRGSTLLKNFLVSEGTVQTVLFLTDLEEYFRVPSIGFMLALAKKVYNKYIHAHAILPLPLRMSTRSEIHAHLESVPLTLFDQARKEVSSVLSCSHLFSY